jgi:general secretion pathway protein K
MRRDPKINQRGAALITVLMIIAAMSVVALGVTQSVTNATQRARALDGQAQLRLYAAAAEEVAKSRIAEIMAPIEGRLSADLPGFGQPQTIPVDGGSFTVTVRDATNCFDLNSVVLGADGDALQPQEETIKAFGSILETTDIDPFQATGLVSSLVDWLDSDTVPGQGGAEDAFYLGLTPSYRTSGQPLTSLQELRAIRGFTPEIIDSFDGLLCARPTHTFAAMGQVNLNTLTVNQAPLLRLALSDAIEVEEVERLIAARPIGGWPDLPTFLLEPAIAKIDPALRKTDRMLVSTTLVEVFADVSYRGQMMKMRYLFETLPGKPVRTLQRQRVG